VYNDDDNDIEQQLVGGDTVLTGHDVDQYDDENKLLNDILTGIKTEQCEGIHSTDSSTSTERQMYCCEHCGEMVSTQRALSIHCERHVGPASKPCVHCGKMFTRHEGLRRHLASVHSHDRKIVCNECGKRFTRNDHLRLHMRCHTGERPYLCNDCGKCFQTGPHLKKHQLSHSGYKPFMCKVCPRGFVNVESLRKHLNHHLS